VVSYDTVIAFETQDDRIRPGMSAAASIVTDLRTDTLLIPRAAVRAAGGGSVVEVLPGATGAEALAAIGVTSPMPPEQRNITTGLDNGQMVEVLDGLAEGERIVVRTVDTGAKTSAAPSTSAAIRVPGLTGGGSFGGAAGGQRGVTR
ncbi:MAG: hypothetical protein AAB368_08325, partial [bacterium]